METTPTEPSCTMVWCDQLGNNICHFIFKNKIGWKCRNISDSCSGSGPRMCANSAKSAFVVQTLEVMSELNIMTSFITYHSHLDQGSWHWNQAIGVKQHKQDTHSSNIGQYSVPATNILGAMRFSLFSKLRNGPVWLPASSCRTLVSLFQHKKGQEVEKWSVHLNPILWSYGVLFVVLVKGMYLDSSGVQSTTKCLSSPIWVDSPKFPWVCRSQFCRISISSRERNVYVSVGK